MKKAVVVLVIVAALGGGAWLYRRGAAGTSGAPAAVSTGSAALATGGRSGGRGATTMTVETALVGRREIIDYVTVVGNLIGETTVDVAPRVGGRIESVLVKLGDRVAKGQPVAKMEDRDIREQVNQAEANLEVNKATALQRESDLKVAQGTLDRIKASFNMGLVSKENLEGAEARLNSAVAAVSVVKAQLLSNQARIDELKITLSNTNIVSPLDGFVARRNLDAGAFAGTNTVIISVVDLSSVRMVANLIEKDFRRVSPGVQAIVEVDAYPGEHFAGQVSRVAPVFDPATRTASMEIEVPNPGFRLKRGSYARVKLTAERRPDVMVVPRNAIVDIEGRRGVFVVEAPEGAPAGGQGAGAGQTGQMTVRFVQVRSGLADAERVEIVEGLDEGQRVVTVGALALRDGDRVNLMGGGNRGRRGQ